MTVQAEYSRLGIDRSAEISECGRYRWWLRRAWKSGRLFEEFLPEAMTR